MTRALLALVLVALAAPAHATPTRAHPLEDAANMIPDSDEPALEAELGALRDQGVTLGVMIVFTTGSQSIEAYARAHAADWADGATPAVLFVLAVNDRHSRLEVSDALRSKFPDARAQSILDNIKGYLRSSDYTGAVRAVMTEVKNAAAGVGPDLESPHPQVADPSDTAAPPAPAPAPATTYDDSPRRRQPTDYTPIILISIIGGLFVFAAWIWARSRLEGRATLTGNGLAPTRPLWLEMLWCMCLILGGIVYVAIIIASSSSTSSGSSWTSSSSSWGSGGSSFGSSSSRSSSSSSSSSGGGWSGGGASSSW